MDGCDGLRRRFVAIATGTYDHANVYPNLDVAAEVRALQAWFCGEALPAARRFSPDLTHLAADPDEDAVRTALRTADAFGPDDALVLYLTGHGDVENDRHRTILRASDPDRLVHTSLNTVDVVEWLAGHRGLDHVLLVIDQCYAGGLLDEVTGGLRLAIPDTWLALLVSESNRTAGLGVFTDAVDRAMRAFADGDARDASSLEPYLDSSAFVARVKSVMAELTSRDEVPQRLKVLHDPYSPACCLPNPAHDPGGGDRVTVAPARRDLAILEQDMTAHWRQRAPLGDAETPWVFVGRTVAMQRLVDVTAKGARPGTVVVTGRAGSGKSALLARLVTCSDPTFRAEHAALLASVAPAPDEHAVDAAIVATGKGPEQVVAQLARALGVDVGQITAATGLSGALGVLESDLRARAEAPTVVIDALDESADPEGVLSTVLTPLNRPDDPLLRLLVGVRSVAGTGGEQDRVRDLASRTVAALGAAELAVDDDPWWRDTDLEAFVAGALHHDPSPYEDDHALAGRVAARVAERSERSFLLAKLVAEDLVARADTLDADDRRLDELLAGGITEVLRRDLDDVADDLDDRERATLLLRAVALAFGRGLPWRHVWPTAATAIAVTDRVLGDADVAWLLGTRLAGYLVRDLEDGVTVHRLFHDALRERLAEGVDDYIPQMRGLAVQHPSVPQAHARITRALLPQLTDPARPAPSYVRRHLVEHAAAADLLTDEVLNARTLPSMDGSTLSRALRLTDVDPTTPLGFVISAWRGVRQRWSWDDPKANAAALDVALVAISADAPARDGGDGPTWQPRWAEWAAGGTVVGRETGSLRAIAHGFVAGRSCLLTADWRPDSWEREAGVMTWDAATGDQVGPGVEVPEVRSLLVVERDDAEPIAVAGGWQVTAFDAATGTIHWTRPREGIVYALAELRLDGRSGVAVGTSDGAVHLFDASTGEDLGPSPAPPGAGVRALDAMVDPDDAERGPRLVVGRGDGSVEQWWPATGEPAGPTIDVGDEVNAVVLVRAHDGLRLVTGDRAGRTRVWDAATGEPTGAVHQRSGEVRALARQAAPSRRRAPTTPGVGRQDLAPPVAPPVAAAPPPPAQRLVASAGHDAQVVVLDADTGHLVGEAMPHPGPVEDVAFGVVDGRLLVVTACTDGNARLWDPERPSAARVATGGTIHDVSLVAGVGGQALLVGSRADDALPVWHAADGEMVATAYPPGPPPRPATKIAPDGPRAWPPVTAAGLLAGRPVLLAGRAGEVTLARLDEPGPRVTTRWLLDGVRPTEVDLFGVPAGPAVVALHVGDEHLLAVVADGDTLRTLRLGPSEPEGWLEELASRTIDDAPAAHGRAVAVHAPAGWDPLVTVVGASAVDVLDAETLTPACNAVPRDLETWGSEDVAIGEVRDRLVLAQWHPDGIDLWDLEAGEPSGPGVRREGLNRNGLALVPLGDDAILLSGHLQTVRAWHPRTGRLRAELPFGTAITSLAALPQPDGTVLVATGGPGVVVATLRP